jgi:hypothetical protein
MSRDKQGTGAVKMDNQKTEEYLWLDKYIVEQTEQREILAKLAYPYDPAELCELVDEQEELIMNNQ